MQDSFRKKRGEIPKGWIRLDFRSLFMYLRKKVERACGTNPFPTSYGMKILVEQVVQYLFYMLSLYTYDGWTFGWQGRPLTFVLATLMLIPAVAFSSLSNLYLVSMLYDEEIQILSLKREMKKNRK